MHLTEFKVLTFDCYGTLIDWESGMVEALKPLTGKTGRTLNRNEILEAHAFHESSQQRQTPAKPYQGSRHRTDLKARMAARSMKGSRHGLLKTAR